MTIYPTVSTGGDWAVDNCDDYAHILAAPEGRPEGSWCIASVYGGCRAERTANVYLLRAAPTMRASLERFVNEVSRKRTRITPETIQMAAEALASIEATGSVEE